MKQLDIDTIISEIKLRKFSYYDENGCDSETGLQIWDPILKIWKGVHHIRVPKEECEKSMLDEFKY